METRLTAVLATIALIGCNDTGVYTLYRSSPDIGDIKGDNARIHVATFDAADGADYNRENCEAARSLFVSQPGVVVRYWCERGRFAP